MPAFKNVDWEAVGMTVVERGALIVAVIVVGFIGLRIARWAIDRAVESALDREAGDSTTAELSAVERRKRIETLQGFFVKVGRLVVAVLVLLVLPPLFWAGNGVVGRMMVGSPGMYCLM